jgi:hypothetical protein
VAIRNFWLSGTYMLQYISVHLPNTKLMPYIHFRVLLISMSAFFTSVLFFHNHSLFLIISNHPFLFCTKRTKGIFWLLSNFSGRNMSSGPVERIIPMARTRGSTLCRQFSKHFTGMNYSSCNLYNSRL